MRLRTYNNRKARRTRAAPLGRPFCYILFEARYTYLDELKWHDDSGHDLVMATPKSMCGARRWCFVPRQVCYDKKEYFPTYADAIVWLTKIKLSLMDKPEKYRLFKLAKIVEGYYTKGKREHVTRVTDLTNVSHSLPTASQRRADKQRQLREQRRQQLLHAKTMAWRTPKAASTSSIRNSRCTTGNSSTQTMGGGWDGGVPVSWPDSSTTACIN